MLCLFVLAVDLFAGMDVGGGVGGRCDVSGGVGERNSAGGVGGRSGGLVVVGAAGLGGAKQQDEGDGGEAVHVGSLV